MNNVELGNLADTLRDIHTVVMTGLIEEDSEDQREVLALLADTIIDAVLIANVAQTNKVDEEIESYMLENVNLDGSYEDEDILDEYEEGEPLSLETVFSPYDGIVINIDKSGITIIQDEFTHEISLDAIDPQLKVSDAIEKDQVIGYRILK